MRSPVDRRFGSFRFAAALSALALCSYGAVAGARPAPAPPAPVNGPQADYPVVVGSPYSVKGTTFSPEDVMNYDLVGYVAADAAGGSRVSGSHHTLPLPSYVEVTSLTTGHTILVRLERRGPMDSADLIALSPGALAQLDASAGTPVRVRRVNPPEEQRAMLRAGQQAPLRMDTPMSLVEVLKRKLPGQGAVSVAQAAPSAVKPVPVTASAAAPQASVATAVLSAPQPVVARASAAPALPPLEPRGAPARAAQSGFQQAFSSPAPAARTGTLLVQAGAFSTADRAKRVADALGGQVSPAGKLFRVRTGPFATRNEAEASLAKVRAAGYTDARIQTSG
jgi:rare lipoprotein A